MQYLRLLYYADPTCEAVLWEEGTAAAYEGWAYAETLRQRGNLLACERFQSISTATTIRIGGGEVAITDGPHAMDARHRLLSQAPREVDGRA